MHWLSWARVAREGFLVVRQKNVIAPLLALDVVIALPCFLMACFGHSMQMSFFIAGSVPVGFTLIAYAGFAFVDADRLQTEEYLEKARARVHVETRSGDVYDAEQLQGAAAPPMRLAAPVPIAEESPDDAPR